MNITEIANRVAEKHYPNLPTSPCDNAYRDGRMNELRKLVEGELKNLRLGVVMPRISYFKDDNGVQFEPHYEEVLTDIKEDGTIEFYVIDSDYQRNLLTPVYVA